MESKYVSMSEKSKKFWQDQISKKGEINVPDLLDDWANVVHGELSESVDDLTTANRDLDTMLKQQVEENARMVDVCQAVKAENERLREGIESVRNQIDDSVVHPSDIVIINGFLKALNALLSPANRLNNLLDPPADGDGKETAKSLSIDEMNEYCIQWCQSLNLSRGESKKISDGLEILEMSSVYPPMAWVFNGSVRIAKHPDYCAKGFIVMAYAMIRSIQRGEIRP